MCKLKKPGGNIRPIEELLEWYISPYDIADVIGISALYNREARSRKPYLPIHRDMMSASLKQRVRILVLGRINSSCSRVSRMLTVFERTSRDHISNSTVRACLGEMPRDRPSTWMLRPNIGCTKKRLQIHTTDILRTIVHCRNILPSIAASFSGQWKPYPVDHVSRSIFNWRTLEYLHAPARG